MNTRKYIKTSTILHTKKHKVTESKEILNINLLLQANLGPEISTTLYKAEQHIVQAEKSWAKWGSEWV